MYQVSWHPYEDTDPEDVQWFPEEVESPDRAAELCRIHGVSATLYDRAGFKRFYADKDGSWWPA